MIKNIACSTLLLFLLALPTTVFSHAYLEDSNPKNEAIIRVEMQEIQLFFSTRIEPLSTFELLNEQEESIEIDQYTVEQDTITGKLDNPLPNGTYIVNWKIIAADGHTSDGQFSFDVEQVVEEVEKSEEEINEESIIEEETNQVAPDVDETTQAKASPLANLWLFVLIILGGIIYILWRKRRNA